MQFSNSPTKSHKQPPFCAAFSFKSMGRKQKKQAVVEKKKQKLCLPEDMPQESVKIAQR